MAWDFYQIFMAVARHGGLTGAAGATGLSPATIGRRMLDLEERIGRPIFVRSQTGYGLTTEGGILFEHLSEMEGAARKIDAWRAGAAGAPLVRIAMGTWNAWLLGENMSAIRKPGDDFEIDLQVGERRASLAHRENDIGIRATEPREPNLAARRLGEVAYAAYRAAGSDGHAARSWIAVGEEDAVSPYLRWPHQNAAGQIAIAVSRPTSLRDMIAGGAGIGVLPCFVGDSDGRLRRVGSEISELLHAQWIVMNCEDRHRREIRIVVDRMTRFLKVRADLFSGRRWRKEA